MGLYSGSTCSAEMAARPGISVQQTADGGYVLFGDSTSSANGTVTDTSYGGRDSWVVRLDSGGAILWQHLLGGSGDDYGYSGQQTNDGGYVLMGASNSSASGDVTDPNHGSWDFWLVKLDSGGTIQWQKLLGGSGMDYGYAVQQAVDGGYVLFGTSASSTSGDVTGTNHGGADFWVVKLDAIGTVPARVPGGSGLPTDTNTDGKYDDINGNDRRDFADVVLYFNQMAWIATNEPVAAFDYNANTRIDFADVVWLFNHL